VLGRIALNRRATRSPKTLPLASRLWWHFNITKRA
jgi:hypothetical protein